MVGGLARACQLGNSSSRVAVNPRLGGSTAARPASERGGIKLTDVCYFLDFSLCLSLALFLALSRSASLFLSLPFSLSPSLPPSLSLSLTLYLSLRFVAAVCGDVAGYPATPSTGTP